MTMQFTDTATLSGTRITDGGFLVAEAFAVRTGIQIYLGSEVGLADRDYIRVYRPESEVKDAKSLQSFSHAPITMGHPTEAVTADNWNDLAKGEISTEATWENNKIKLPLIIKDADAIQKVQNGERELSAGYNCDLSFEDGFTPEGEAYDAIQRDIRINHVAIVKKGRAGSECRIGDDALNGGENHHSWGAAPLSDAQHKEVIMTDKVQSVVLGDKAVNVAADQAPIIEQFAKDSAKALTDAQADHDKKMAAKDADIEAKDKELAAKDAEIDKLTKGKLTDAEIDQKVQDRAELVANATLVAKDADFKGLSDDAIRKAAVVSVLGDSAIEGKSQSYIDARFDVMLEAVADEDPLKTVLGDGVKTKTTTLDKAYEDRDAGLANAWKNQPSKEA